MRWVDSLPDPYGRTWAKGGTDLELAAFWLASSFVDNPAGTKGEEDDCWFSYAGALIRRHRKTLHAYTYREDSDADDYTDAQLVWRALHWVVLAQRTIAPWDRALACRKAECALRTLWKRHNEPAMWVCECGLSYPNDGDKTVVDSAPHGLMVRHQPDRCVSLGIDLATAVRA